MSSISAAVIFFMMFWLCLYIISKTYLASIVTIRNGFGSGRRKLNAWAMQVIIFPVFTITAGQNSQLLCKPYRSPWKTVFNEKVWLGDKTQFAFTKVRRKKKKEHKWHADTGYLCSKVLLCCNNDERKLFKNMA